MSNDRFIVDCSSGTFAFILTFNVYICCHDCGPMMTELPLTGMRVLVGRARHQASALSAELRSLGAEVLEIPFIEIRKPRSYAPLDAAIRNIAQYQWLILTSVNGVEAFWARLEKQRIKGGKQGIRKKDLSHLRIAAIGPATKAAIEARGLKVSVVPREYVAESVVASLRSKVNGKRILLARAKVARDIIPRELRRAGARVDVIEAYETVLPARSRNRLQTAMKNPARRPNTVTFTSSSMVKNFVELLGGKLRGTYSNELLQNVRLASIGPITSSTLRELNLRVDIEAKQYTIPGLVQAVVRSLK